MDALTPIILHTQLEGKKTAVSTLTQGEQVFMEDGSTLPQALARLLAAAVAAADVRIVPDIAARDTLPDKHTGVQVWVRDAGGDPTVAHGSAKYLWDQHASEGAGDWLKTAESESMDVVVLWEAIHGVPQVLKFLDISEQGLLTFNGETVYDRRREVAVVDSAAPVPLDMREGALVLERTVGGDDVVPKVVQGGVPMTIVPSLRGPQGSKGDDGTDGVDGGQGLAATISVGNVATGAPGSAATVTNAGSSQAAVLDFTIPQGPPGTPGLAGATPQLNNTVTSTSVTEAATANAVKTAYDRGTEGINAAGAARQVADGFGIGVPARYVESLDLPKRKSGKYNVNGSHIKGIMPFDDWFYIDAYTHDESGAVYIMFATNHAPYGRRFVKTCRGAGTETPWVELPNGITSAVNDTNQCAAASAAAVKTAYDTAVAARQVADSKAPGGFGLGTTSPAITDCNHALRNGWYAGSNLVNAPTGGWYIIFVVEHCHSDNWRYQLAFGYAGAAGMWWRQCNGGTWTGWRQLDGDAAVSASPAHTRGAVAAYANYGVPGYIVGTRRLQVWLDGILCECGGNANQHQYKEIGAAGTWNNVIQWHNYIDASYDITARVR